MCNGRPRPPSCSKAANQGQVFQTLMERFEDFFMVTDKALLKVTNKLPRQAMALHEALEKFP